MKKLLGLLCALLCAPWAQANTMNFVTVLSSPVGSFNKLEAVDSSLAAKAPVINFCTGVGDNGLVTLQGSSHPEMTTLNLSQNTTLGGNGQNYVLSSITMKNGGRLKGSRLLANTVKVDNAAAGKSDKLYTDTLTVVGAKTKNLTVGDKAAYIEGKDGQYSPQMAWSNQYKDDKACKDGNQCAGQYLLKQKGDIAGGVLSCHETALAACGSTGEGYSFWLTLPKCSDVNGWASSYEGSCAYTKSCTRSGGRLDITGVDSSQCNHTNHAFSDADWAVFINPGKADESCQRWGQHGGSSVSHIGWNPSGTACNRYTLSCASSVSAEQVYSHSCSVK